MGKLDDLKPVVKVWPCKVRDTAADLEADDAKTLLDAVMNPAWKYAALETALSAKGIVLGAGTIKAHRLKMCSCVRTN